MNPPGSFGPVASVIRVKDAEDALRVANDSDFGLGSAIWTSDVAKAKELAERVEAGLVFINGMVVSDPRLPFGAIKESGYGSEGGSEALDIAIDDGNAQIGFRRKMIMDAGLGHAERIGNILIAERAVAARLDQYLGEIEYLFGGPGSLLRGRRHTFPVMTSGANDLASPNMSLRFLTRDCAGNPPGS